MDPQIDACVGNREVVVRKIRVVLDFIRNQSMEVPFIANYRKEDIMPELNTNLLWMIYSYDAKARRFPTVQFVSCLLPVHLSHEFDSGFAVV